MKSDIKDIAVYYSIDNDPRYVNFARNSVLSLREFNKNIKVYLFAYGSISRQNARFFSANNVCVINKKRAGKHLARFLKWLSLGQLDENRVLFVDADTIFYRDVNIIFRRFSKLDFYAREETGTIEGGHENGGVTGSYQLRRGGLSALARKFSLRKMPVFNTGVMLFNNSVNKRFTFDEFMYYYISFMSGKIPYPCMNPHIMDEIVFSLVSGRMRSLKHGFLNKDITPWYAEVKTRKARDFGVVTHVWSGQYDEYIKHARRKACNNI